MPTIIVYKKDELTHHGILGQKWGKKQGPPYPLNPSDHSASEKKAGWKKSLGGGRNESEYGTAASSRNKKEEKAQAKQQKKEEKALAKQQRKENKAFEKAKQRNWVKSYNEASAEFEQKVKAINDKYDVGIEYGKDGKLTKESQKYVREVGALWVSVYKESLYRNVGEGTSTIGKDWVDSMPMMRMYDDF